MPSCATKMMFEKGIDTASPTESEIAAVAYQFWMDNGCAHGLDQDDWFRAEAMLRKALAATYEGRTGRQSRDEPEASAELRWEGHWEVWESEWGNARWVWDAFHRGL